ncbi:hypothetical protein M0L20_29355 [Spirosoma sp. RP8]|uniref:Uncharacterized protein n=1 Tax=Spirosoma liriopis TaxID=2937440 RepID=A0ABT0HUY3_9BACT|nr:hypothetical protein [Spirosoma liriopis]MCK8496009.1 hypothetical protein [Spirosoma liriopis]
MGATASTWAVQSNGIGVPEELRDYFTNKFCSPENGSWIVSGDEPYLDFWASRGREWAGEKAFAFLQTCYPQLHFPIEDGINKTQAYVDAVLKGKPAGIDVRHSLVLNQPESLQLTLHESFAGLIPVLVVPDDDDFIKLVQCLLHKNNPVAIPPSMGALLANGINNWERIRELKAQWIVNNSLQSWNEQFARCVLPNPSLYKDKLVILSNKPYSNVSAKQLGLDSKEWVAYSMSIRLEHECTHLYTLNRFGSASNNLHDELVADYMGICKAVGHFKEEWMLAFFGLEDYPAYRTGARLENYVSNTRLSTAGFHQLTGLIKGAVNSIAQFDARVGKMFSVNDQACRMDALCLTDMAVLASANGSEQLFQNYTDRMTALQLNDAVAV